MKIGIIGAGTMGAGIAQAFAMKDDNYVFLCDVSADAAAAGKAKIKTSLERLAAKGKYDEAAVSSILGRIETGISEIVRDCDLVVEAAVEKMELKKKLFRQLHEICAEDTIFASNTSSLSITELSASVGRTVVGMHFFNPAPVMKLVEIVVGISTPSEIVDKVTGIAADIGKTPVEVKDSAGFIVNRILIPMINEAVGILAEGVAPAESIDTAMKLGANHPMGPLATGDLVGLDVCLAIMEVLYSETGDPKYRPHPLMKKMVRGGLLGKKTGQGFFSY